MTEGKFANALMGMGAMASAIGAQAHAADNFAAPPSAMSSPAAASAVPVIGVMDTAISGKYSVPVQSRDFVPAGYKGGSQSTKDGREHGDASVASVINGAGGNANILHANIFVNTPNGGLASSWTSAKRGLDWFHANGVKYVCTNFVLPETEDVRGFVDYAEQLGMKIVTTIGDTNNMTDMPYPASDPRTIATRPDGGKMIRGMKGDVLRLAKYTSSPVATADGNMTGDKPAEGSSFAAARVCGQLASGTATPIK